MSKVYMQVTAEQKSQIDSLVSKSKRFAVVLGKRKDKIEHDNLSDLTVLSIHTSYKAADATARNFQIFGECPMKGVDFVEAYEPITELPVAEACEVELQPATVAQPVIHPSLNWIANKVWGWDYKDCHADNRKLVDLAKVNEYGNIDLSHQDLSHLRLNGAILDSADLSCATLICTDLRDANLKSANLSNALVVNSRFLYANLKLTKLTGVLLRKNDLSEAMLIGATIFPGAVCADNFSRHFVTRLGSANGTLELYKCESGWYVRRGCFSGSLPEFLAAVEKKHGDNEHGKRYRAIVAALCD